MDHVHGLVDRRRTRSTMDHEQRISRSMLECGLTSAAGLESLPQLHEKGEEDEGFLTPGGVGRRDD
jgi:hypothetical protein